MLPLNRSLPKEISLLRRMNALAQPDTLNLGLGKPHVDMPSELRSVAGEVLKEAKLEYSENAGLLSVREALGKKLGLAANDLILTHGAQESLQIAFTAALNPGDEVLVPDPGFPAYATMAKMLRAKPVPYALREEEGRWVHDFSLLQKRITARTRLVVLSAPANPTGADLEEAELRQFLRKNSKKRFRILSDEVYGMLHFHKPYRPLACLDERIVSINSFSKSHALTGWRIGYLASQDSDFRQAALVAHQYIATCASVPAQLLMGKILAEDRLYTGIPTEFRNLYRERLQIFLREFGGELALPAGAFYLFLPLPKGKKDSQKAAEILLKAENVLTIPGIAFGAQGKSYLRLSLALSEAQVRESAKRLARFYASS